MDWSERRSSTRSGFPHGHEDARGRVQRFLDLRAACARPQACAAAGCGHLRTGGRLSRAWDRRHGRRWRGFYRTAGELFAGHGPGSEISIMRMEPVHVGSGHDRSDAARRVRCWHASGRARSAAEREARAALQRLAAAERAAQDARHELLAEQSARQNADQTLGEVREELIRERAAKEAAELATKEALSRKPTHWRTQESRALGLVRPRCATSRTRGRRSPRGPWCSCPRPICIDS